MPLGNLLKVGQLAAKQISNKMQPAIKKEGAKPAPVSAPAPTAIPQQQPQQGNLLGQLLSKIPKANAAPDKNVDEMAQMQASLVEKGLMKSAPSGNMGNESGDRMLEAMLADVQSAGLVQEKKPPKPEPKPQIELAMQDENWWDQFTNSYFNPLKFGQQMGDVITGKAGQDVIKAKEVLDQDMAKGDGFSPILEGVPGGDQMRGILGGAASFAAGAIEGTGKLLDTVNDVYTGTKAQFYRTLTLGQDNPLAQSTWEGSKLDIGEKVFQPTSEAIRGWTQMSMKTDNSNITNNVANFIGKLSSGSGAFKAATPVVKALFEPIAKVLPVSKIFNSGQVLNSVDDVATWGTKMRAWLAKGGTEGIAKSPSGGLAFIEKVVNGFEKYSKIAIQNTPKNIAETAFQDAALGLPVNAETVMGGALIGNLLDTIGQGLKVKGGLNYSRKMKAFGVTSGAKEKIGTYVNKALTAIDEGFTSTDPFVLVKQANSKIAAYGDIVKSLVKKNAVDIGDKFSNYVKSKIDEIESFSPDKARIMKEQFGKMTGTEFKKGADTLSESIRVTKMELDAAELSFKNSKGPSDKARAAAEIEKKKLNLKRQEEKLAETNRLAEKMTPTSFTSLDLLDMKSRASAYMESILNSTKTATEKSDAVSELWYIIRDGSEEMLDEVYPALKDINNRWNVAYRMRDAAMQAAKTGDKVFKGTKAARSMVRTGNLLTSPIGRLGIRAGLRTTGYTGLQGVQALGNLAGTGLEKIKEVISPEEINNNQ